MTDDNNVGKIIPNLTGLLANSKAERDLELSIRRIYEYIDRQVFILKADIADKLKSTTLATDNTTFSILNSDDGLKKITGLVAVGGKITIRDGLGNHINILTD